MRRRFFTILTVLFLLCGCSQREDTDTTTANDIGIDIEEEQITATITGEMSADAQFYGTLECIQRGKNIEIEREGKVVAVIENAKKDVRSTSLDRKAIALSVLPEGEADLDEEGFNGYSIYYYRDELIHVADNATNMLLTDDGKTISYKKNVAFDKLIDGDFDGFYNGLCDHYIWNGTESVFLWNKSFYVNMIFSPDGKDFYYSEQNDTYEEGFTDYYRYNNGEPVLAVENAKNIVVSNNAEYFYGFADGSFFVQSGLVGERQVLMAEDDVKTYNNFYNADKSQVMICTDDAIYMSVNGGKAKKIVDAVLKNTLQPPLCEIDAGLHEIKADFAGRYLHAYDNCIYRITEDYEAELILENVHKIEMAEDRDTIIYTTGDVGTENRIATSKLSDPSNPVIFTPNETPLNEISWGRFVTLLEVSYDGKTVYYSTEDCDLYMVRDGEKTLIDNDTDFMLENGSARIYNNDDLYYIKDGGNAVYRFDGKESVKVKTFPGETTWLRKDYGALEVSVKFMEETREYLTYDGETFFQR